MERIDERDVMFSRMARRDGTNAYREYYEANPDKKGVDDELRNMPNMNGNQTRFHHPFNSPMVDAAFGFLSDIKGLVEGPNASEYVTKDTSENFTKKLNGLAKFYGAKITGVAVANEKYYYSHRGRFDENFGDLVDNILPYTFVFAVEMEKDYIDSAPFSPQSIAVTKGYVDAAIIGMIITYYIKSLGYEARNHMDGNYLMVMPLAAKAAGLGDIGRHGLLITPEYGARIRLGAVTTSMPLKPDKISKFNVKDFCSICGRCAQYCPAGAISKFEADEVFGEKRWQIKQELCYKKWLEFGTDCGICLAKCPFSTPIEDSEIEKYIANSGYAHEILKRVDSQKAAQVTGNSNLDWLK